MTFSRRTGHRATATALVVLSLGLAACQSSPTPPPVASLEPTESSTSTSDPATTGPADTTTSGSERPQLRLDDSPERVDQLHAAYDQCLVDHGAQARVGGAPGAASADQPEGGVQVVEPVPQAARDACVDVLPLLPPELDPALNPDYRDQFVAYVGCMQERGLRVHVVEDASGDGSLAWTFDDDAPPVSADMPEIDDACLVDAFQDPR